MSRANDKCIIELYGLPSSGKSTLARNIASEYGFVHVAAPRVSRFDYLLFSARYPIVVLCWLHVILKNYYQTKSIRHLRYNISLLFTSLKRIHQAQRDTASRLIIDEGLVQRFLSYSDIVLSEKDLSRLLLISPLGTVLVLVNDRHVEKDRYDSAHDRGSLGTERLHIWRHNMAQNVLKIKGILSSRTTIVHFETSTSMVEDILKVVPK